MTEEERQKQVDAAVHSGEMEGLSISEAAIELAKRYVRGEINVDEMVELIKEEHGLGD